MAGDHQTRSARGWSLMIPALAILLGNSGIADAPGIYRFDDEPLLLAYADAFAPWADLMDRIGAERPAVLSCLEDQKSCPYYLKGYRHIVRRAQSVGDFGKLHLVNRFINKRRWVSDDFRTDEMSNDIWLTPIRFLRDGGDCEDFAVAKYFMLRDLGFEPDNLRIVISSDHKTREPHAVVAVRIGDKVLLMETDDTVRRAREHHKYRFLYSVNENYFWDHAGVVSEATPAAIAHQ